MELNFDFLLVETGGGERARLAEQPILKQQRATWSATSLKLGGGQQRCLLPHGCNITHVC